MDKKNIAELLNDYTLVVPEIQREYVWGSNKQILIQFLENMNNKLKDGECNIGFLYSYTSGSEKYIIDGQQRFTSVILLLYYLSLNGKQEDFKNRLFKDEKRSFSYRVRSITASFTDNLFRSNCKSAEEIRNRKWYKLNYDNDTTIRSMIDALDIIDKQITDCPHITYEKVLKQVEFWYFDVNETSQGEELYITMNSRGEKLTDSEQIKPRLLNKITSTTVKEKFGKEWDEWEEFFYQKRSEENDIKSVDTAMNNIIRIAVELETGNEFNTLDPIKVAEILSLPRLQTYIQPLYFLEGLKNENVYNEIARLYGNSDSDANFMVLKSLITERLKGTDEPREYERVFHVMRNQIRRNKIEKHIGLLEFLREYKKSGLSFYDYILQDKSGLINGHELDKVKIYVEFGEKAEDSIWEIQSRKMWRGYIKPLITWGTADEKFDFERFEKYHDLLSRFFKENQENGCCDDIVRRALLCSNLKEYPLYETHFGYTRYEWIEIFDKNTESIQKFLDGYNNTVSVEEYCSSIIEKADKNNPWYEFADKPYLLEYLDTKHIYYNDVNGMILVQRRWAVPLAVNVMHMFQYMKKDIDKESEWAIWYWRNWTESCVVVNNAERNIFFEIKYRQDNERKRFQVLLYKANDSEKTKTELAGVAENFSFEYSGDRYSKTVEFDYEKVKILICKMISEI